MLENTAIFLAAAVALVPIFKRLGLGSVLGYLAAGAIIGPSGLGLIDDVASTMRFAEFGVVLLLFLIGLELEPSRLWRLRGTVFGLGAAQVLISTAVLALVGWLSGADPVAAGIGGAALAMSSTAFATQILGERHELSRPHGQAAFGILLFQDLAAIPLLALIPVLGTAHEGSESGHGHAPNYPMAMVVIVGLVLGGRFLLRPAFGLIARVRSHELSVAAALLVVIATAMLMESVGLSMALGAFLAGVLLADSEYRHELEANIEPFKGLLLGLFFIAVGMSANLGLLLSEPLIIVGIAVSIVAVKAVVLFGLGTFSKLDRPSSLGLAVSISQGGEFAFVIFGAALSADILDSSTIERLIVAVTLSMMMTPLLFMARDAYLARTEKKEMRPFDDIRVDGSDVVIAGFGRFGQIVGRVLRLKHISFTALDNNPEHIDFLRRFGNRVHYGDASRLDLLRSAKVEEARVFVLAIDDFEASMRTLRTVKEHFPHVKIVARARNRQHAYALLGAGVETVIRETFAGSVEAAGATLLELGVTPALTRAALKTFVEYDERAVRELAQHREDESKLIASAQKYSTELERIFDADAASGN
jgi:monovalent cation:proton antiporter-2 (CPA2) family protein